MPSDAEKALLIAKISLPKPKAWHLAVCAKRHGFYQNREVFGIILNRRKILKSPSVFSKVVNLVWTTDNHNIVRPVLLFQLTPFSGSWAKNLFEKVRYFFTFDAPRNNTEYYDSNKKIIFILDIQLSNALGLIEIAFLLREYDKSECCVHTTWIESRLDLCLKIRK